VVLPDNVPVLMMDADFDEIVARRFFPHLTQVTVVEGQRRNLHVTQLIGNVMPKSRFVDEPGLDGGERQRRANRCRDLSYLIEVEADRLRVMGDRLSVFVSSYKGVDEWLRKHRPYPGVDLSHYNVNRGRNRWNGVDAIITHGRPQPGVGQLELMTKALFYSDPLEIDTIPPDARGDIHYQLALRRYETKDGTVMQGPVEVHIDPRCNALLRQIRECEIIQTIDRGRFIHDRKTVCRVLILTNIPLPGVVVDQFVTWEELMPTKIEVALARGGIVPMSGDRLYAMYPKLFGSARTASREVAEFRRKAEGLCNFHNQPNPLIR
jgi:hypothetical protein